MNFSSVKLEDDQKIKNNAEKIINTEYKDLSPALNSIIHDRGHLPVYFKFLEKSPPQKGDKVENFIRITGLYRKLKAKGIDYLHKFQEEAYNEILNGNNVTISAPTGMGKTEAFLLPILYTILKIQPNPIERKYISAIFIYPTKALAADQKDKIRYYCQGLGLRVETYDGDTPQNIRQQIFRRPPDILITNADMIHYHLGNHAFQSLIKGIRFLVLDEIHLCVGSYGTNIIWIIRRIRRFTAGVQCIGASATISNARQFSETIFERKVKYISAGSARKSDMYLTILYPKEQSNLSIMAKVTDRFVRNGNKSLVFGNGHKASEVLNLMLKQRDIKSDIHRAGLSLSHRKKVEDRFKKGELDVLVSTPTLELGIDIGSLDSVISQLTNLTSFVQRIGRAGRLGQKSYATLVLSGDDPISAYYARNPNDYLSDFQPAFVEPSNELVAKNQIIAMLLDKTFNFDEIKRYKEYLQPLLDQNLIIYRENKIEIKNRNRLYQMIKDYSIRGIGNSLKILYQKRELGDRVLPIALKELHKGAIYLHGGNSYKVTEFNSKLRTARVLKIPSNIEKTQAYRSIMPTILEIQEEGKIDGLASAYTKLQLTETVDGYIKSNIFTNKVLGKYTLDEPITYTFDTMGFVISLPKPYDFVSHLDNEKKKIVLGGTFHAIEHVLIESGNSLTGGGANQIGGISMGDSGLIFVYDGSEGGSGLSRLLYNNLTKGLTRSLKIMEDCPCKQEDGCPRCTYSYQCGNNNTPLNRIGAIKALEQFGHCSTDLDLNYEGKETFISTPRVIREYHRD